MKNVRILANQIGLVFKKGKFKTVLQEGNYWFFWGEYVSVFERGDQFTSAQNLHVLLAEEAIANELDVLNVADNELLIQFEENRFKTVFTAGKYAFWKGIRDYTYQRADLSTIEISEAIDKQLLTTKLAAWIRSFTVESYERGLLIVNGKMERILEGGNYQWWRNSTIIQVNKADMRQLQIEVSGQEILTKDKANIRLNFFAQYRITDLVKALFENKDYEKQLYVLLQISLREYIGEFTLDELIAKKDSIATYILKNVANEAADLGVTMKNCGIRDIILPGDVKTIMNQVLIAEKKAQANIIMRREETASMRSLLNTAKLMEENEMLWKLKEMEYVEKIAEKINTISVSGNGQMLDQLKEIFVKT